RWRRGRKERATGGEQEEEREWAKAGQRHRKGSSVRDPESPQDHVFGVVGRLERSGPFVIASVDLRRVPETGEEPPLDVKVRHYTGALEMVAPGHRDHELNPFVASV